MCETRDLGIKWPHWHTMSSLPDGGIHREAQALPLSGMARIEAGYSERLQEVGAKDENFEEIVEMAKRYSRAPSL